MVPHQLLHLLGLALISCKARKKTIVSKSSVEAEYRSMVTTTCELQWCISLLRDFDIPAPLPIPMWCDNLTTLHITQNSVFHERMKHLDIDCLIVTLCGSGFNLACFFPRMFLPPLNLSMSSPNPSLVSSSIVCYASWAWLIVFNQLHLKRGMKRVSEWCLACPFKCFQNIPQFTLSM